MLIYFSTGCDRAHISEQWTDLVDRGGLIHISDTIFTLFASMEMEVRSHLRAENPSLLKAGLKELLTTSVLQNEEVQFYWSVVSANWVKEEADELLRMIVQHWITLRGFSFVASFMETFKRENKTTTQKSKGTRKTLIGMPIYMTCNMFIIMVV